MFNLRSLAALSTVATLMVTTAHADTRAEILEALETGGYTRVEIAKDGRRTIYTATGPRGSREVVVNTNSGRILSDETVTPEALVDVEEVVAQLDPQLLGQVLAATGATSVEELLDQIDDQGILAIAETLDEATLEAIAEQLDEDTLDELEEVLGSDEDEDEGDEDEGDEDERDEDEGDGDDEDTDEDDDDDGDEDGDDAEDSDEGGDEDADDGEEEDGDEDED